MRKVSDHMRLVKREAGANPARTRHRDSQATAYYHWETGKGKQCGTKSGELPYCEIQGFAVYESVFSITIQNFFLCICIAQRIMCEQAAAESCCFFVHISILEIHEKRTMRNEKKNNVSSDARSFHDMLYGCGYNSNGSRGFCYRRER